MDEGTLHTNLCYSKWYKNRKIRTASKKRGTSSKYIGVSKTRNKWNAYFDTQNGRKNLGNYGDEVTAARIVDREYIRCYGNQKRTNFKYSHDDLIKIINEN